MFGDKRVEDSRARDALRPTSGNSALSSGPCSRPVKAASRSGWNSPLPLRPVAAFSASVHFDQVGFVPRLGRQQVFRLREIVAILVGDHRGDRAVHQRRQIGDVGEDREIAAQRQP